MGTDETTYGTILTPTIYNKLPADIRKNITRDKGDDNWDLYSLRRAIKKGLCVQDAGNVSNTRSNQESQEFIPTANFVTGANHKKTIKQGTTVKQCFFVMGNTRQRLAMSSLIMKKGYQSSNRRKSVLIALENTK